MLEMPVIRALEVATFYTMFNLSPVGRYHVQLCGTTPCMLRGAEAIKEVCRSASATSAKSAADGAFSWVEVECLGACCNAPMVQINDDYYEDLDAGEFRQIARRPRRGAAGEDGIADRARRLGAGRRPDFADDALWRRWSSGPGVAGAAPVANDDAPAAPDNV